MFSFFKPTLDEKFTYERDQIEIELEKITYIYEEEQYIKLAFSLSIDGENIHNVTFNISDKITLEHLGRIEEKDGFYALTKAMKELPDLDPEANRDAWKSFIDGVERAEKHHKRFQEMQTVEQKSDGLRIGYK